MGTAGDKQQLLNYSCEGVAEELASWREQLTIDKAKQLCRQSTKSKYSVAILACGGMLDTLAAIQAGLIPIWGSDTDNISQHLWKDLVGSECYGDAFKLNYESMRRPTILKTGFPCPDYTGLGSQKGAQGATGDLYVKQAELIIRISPCAAIIEMTDNALKINQGREVNQLINQLSTDYVVHKAVIPVWIFGDASNRARLFIIAIHRRIGAAAHQYQYPTTQAPYNYEHYHIAADVAVPDSAVPSGYILRGEPTELYPWTEPKPGRIHQLGSYGAGAGHCHDPHPLQSWWGVPSTQLTSNGGSRRVMMSWRPGQPINQTRLTVPIETIRMASLSQTYLAWVTKILQQTSCGAIDSTIRRLVNGGVPLRTSTAIDQSVIQLLQQAGIQPDVPASHQDEATALGMALVTETDTYPGHTAMKADMHIPYIRSMLIDTGATGSLNYIDIESRLLNATPSQYTIAVAKGNTTMTGSKDGYLPIWVLNTNRSPGIRHSTRFGLTTTTVNDLRTELYSMDGPYRHGRFNLFLRQPDYGSGVSELYRAAKGDEPELRIPLRYNYTGAGGWWLDYTTHSNPNETHQTLLMKHHHDMTEQNSEANTAQLMKFTYSTTSAHQLYTQLMHHPNIMHTIAANNAAVETITAQHPDERQIKGVKAGLKHGRQKLPIKLFHQQYAHIGNCSENCHVCKMVKGCMRRIYKTVDPYRETRVAHTWSMDTITFSHRSLNGSKYATVLRCKATGVIKLLCCYLKSDMVIQFEQWVLSMRADPAYSDLPYRAVSVIVTDEPGEWSRKSVEWQAMLLRLGEVEIIHVTPETSKEAGHAESTNSIIEEITKAILMQQNLPEDHWEVAALSAEWLLNRFPNLATDATAPIDGDQPLPLEQITRGRYSRRQIYRELSYYVMPGTPALVHLPEVKGSRLEPKVRWGIAWGMYREQVIFKCPFVASTFRSKSFSAFHLRDNMNYGQFLGLSTMPTTRKSLAIPGDQNTVVTVHLLPAQKSGNKGTPPVIQLQSCDENDVQNIYVNDHTPNNPDSHDSEGEHHLLDDPSSELGGSVNVLRNTQQQLAPDPSIGLQLQQQDLTYKCRQGQSGLTSKALGEDQQAKGRVRGSDNRQYKTDTRIPNHTLLTPGVKASEDSLQFTVQGQQQAGVTKTGPLPVNGPYVSIEPIKWPAMPHHDRQSDSQPTEDTDSMDEISNILAEYDALTTGVNVSFTQLCKHYKIPHELHDIYYTWLLELRQDHRMRFNQELIPRGRGAYLKMGLKVPAPQGKRWRDLVEERNLKQNKGYKQDSIRANRAIIDAITQIEKDVMTVQVITRQQGDDDETIQAMQARRAKKKRTSAAGASAGKQPPASISKALRDEDLTEAFKWLESINKEWDGLTELGVLDHGYTRQQLIDLGITNTPIPFSVCLTYKYDKEGNVERYKTRMALAGHRGNMQHGIHFNQTYSSTPVQHTSKILQALMVRLKLNRLAFDIKMAYCQADMPDDQLIAVRYPEGFRRYNDTGDELYIILRKNLYGHPAAGRIWEKERNKVLMELFNTDGWTCKRCIKEPCLFVIIKQGKRTWMMVWTDDCDLVGEDESILHEIYQRINNRWESKLIDPAYMLGIRREVTVTPEGEMQVELTMIAFIEAMAEAFKHHLKKRSCSTPLPDGFFIHKDSKTPEQEIKSVLDRGYQRLFGMLLWAARGTFPECLEGTSMLGRVMAAPTEQAWEAACHMLTYMHTHKHHGIRFTSNGNSKPVAYVDSSNKPDPTDSKCQYGYVIMWQGGCIITCSKKLAHVGLSAAHNEYMAAHWCNRHTAWMRDLLTEMGIEDAVLEPTITYGDNRAANLLCEEDIITCGNQFMQVPYHYNKEATQQGVIRMQYVPTKFNLADLFTKSVSRQVLQELLPVLLGQREAVWPTPEPPEADQLEPQNNRTESQK